VLQLTLIPCALPTIEQVPGQGRQAQVIGPVPQVLPMQSLRTAPPATSWQISPD
jgi:hypothetical protein